MKKKAFILFVCAALLLGMLPAAAYAQGEEKLPEELQEEVIQEEVVLEGATPATIPECVPKPVSYTGNAHAVSEFFDEPLMALCSVIGSPDLTNVGTADLVLQAPGGYIFAAPDDEGQPAIKTFRVQIDRAKLATAAVRAVNYDGQEHSFADFLAEDQSALAADYAALTELYSVNDVLVSSGTAPAVQAVGQYKLGLKIKDDSYEFAEPSDAGEPLIKNYDVNILQTYTVHFDLKGIEGAPADQTVVAGGKVTDPNFSLEGYEFYGWFKEPEFENRWVFDSDTVTKATTLYGKILAIYDVTFVTFGIGGNEDWTVEVRDGEYVPRPQPPHALADGTLEDPEGHYSFLGWADANGQPWGFLEDDIAPELKNEVRDNLAIYAVWDAEDVEVSFNMMGHGTQLSSYTADYGSKIDEPEEPEEKGWKFIGWYKDEECTEEWDFDTDVLQGDTVLYAKWLKLYTVTFKANGHGTAPKTQTVVEGGKVTKPANPTAKGYYFVGWYKEKSCVNQWKFANDVVTQDTILYAKWTVNNPKTGDEEDNMRFYAVMSLIALGTAAVIVCGNVKKRKE